MFRNELIRLGVETSAVTFLEMGLHDNPPILAKTLQEHIANLEDSHPDLEEILLLYGYCGGGIVGIKSDRVRLVIPKAHDCIALFLGSNQLYTDIHKLHPGTYFFSPGWIDGGRVPGNEREAHLRELYMQRYQDEETVDELLEMDKETFSVYKKGAYIDTLKDSNACHHCAECVKTLGWEFLPLSADLEWFASLFDHSSGAWKNCMVFAPGTSVTPAFLQELTD